MARLTRAVGAALGILALSALLLAFGEGALRVVGRLRTGEWPATQVARFYDAVRANLTALYRPHPWLNAAPRPGARAVAGDNRASFNSLGYRSPERALAKAPGTVRIVCSGGSTTFDIRVTADEDTWPWQLERRLAGGTPVEVWNAGFPGWTSLENLIALEIRDVDLRPDVVLLFQGINDLQPAGLVPFDPQYETFHPEIVRRSLAVDPAPLPAWERSVLLEAARTMLLGPRTFSLAPVDTGAGTVRAERLPDAAVATFARNVRSFVAVARAHGAAVVLVTQPLRIRQGLAATDVQDLERWIPGLHGRAALVEIERLNDVLRGLADQPGVVTIDAAREAPWVDADFRDCMHFNDAGAAKFASFLAERLRPRLPSP